jgi:hypothetical protein
MNKINIPLSEAQQRELLAKVVSNEVHWREALDAITSQQKPWNTKEWKERRKSKLATQCGKCGTAEPPLVLQHTWHPHKISQLFYQARRQDFLTEWTLWMETHPIVVDAGLLTPDADGCPQCRSTTIRYKSRSAMWVCACKTGGTTCGATFINPIRVVSPRTISSHIKTARQTSQAQFEDESGVGKKVTISAIEEHLRYVSLNDTKTLCKRCAFVEDKTPMRLCAVCKKRYHSEKYDRCSACAGIDTTEIREFFEGMKARDEWIEGSGD